jgi:dipeptidase D
MNAPRGLLVDHKNNDTLDNRRANLRLATRRENSCNKRKQNNTFSRFIGVSFSKRRGKWCASISNSGKKIWLGYFVSEVEAARAYDDAAKRYHGEFARLNFCEEVATAKRPCYNIGVLRMLNSVRRHFDRSDALHRGVEKSIKKTDFSTCLRLARNDNTRCFLQSIVLVFVLGILVFAGCIASEKTAVSRSNEMTTKKMTLKDAKAKHVWEIFRQVSAIPRCSKNEEIIIEWLKDFAKNHNLACRGDAVGNTVIEIPPSKGYEKSPAVVLQSHVDMVCEKTPESKHDFSKDPIDLIERDGWITADGTTLGADNGLGVSLVLALAEGKLPHPRLELLFTVDEETGLTGANGLQQGFITGKYLINLDGEDESFIVGCAGGENTEITLKLDWQTAPVGFDCYALKVSGLYGGHSGVDIDKGRANAIKLLVKTLRALEGLSSEALAKEEQFDLHICSIDGGKAANAIPRDAGAVLLIAPSRIDEIKKAIVEIDSSFKNEFSKTDPNLKVEMIARTASCERVLSQQCEGKVTNLLSALPAGVYRMSPQFEGVVETSNNLARVETIPDENLIRITTMQRGFELSSMDELTGKISSIAGSFGAKAVTSGRYPSWKPDANSSLLKRAKEIHRKLNKKEPEVRVVHAGLECAVIGEKFPGIEMISVGPTIENPHSPQERLNIASVEKAWNFLLALLPSLK